MKKKCWDLNECAKAAGTLSCAKLHIHRLEDSDLSAYDGSCEPWPSWVVPEET